MINAKVTVLNVNIAEVAKDDVHPVWIDEDCPTTGTIEVVVDAVKQDNAAINESVLK